MSTAPCCRKLPTYTLSGQSQSEYLRRKMAAAPKRVAPRPMGDSSVLTQARRMVAVAGGPAAYNDGQAQQYSSEWLAAARAGCAICADPPQVVHDISCCPAPTVLDPVPLALRGSERVPCCPPRGQPTVEPCCRTGTTNTLWANDIRSGYVAPVPVCVSCPPPAPSPCCVDVEVRF